MYVPVERLECANGAGKCLFNMRLYRKQMEFAENCATVWQFCPSLYFKTRRNAINIADAIRNCHHDGLNATKGIDG